LQRKFREEHEEESYFEGDEDEGQPFHPPSTTVVPPAVDEVAAQEGDGELHRTPRMFSLAQTPLLNHGSTSHHMEENDVKENHQERPVEHHEKAASLEQKEVQEGKT
jgi:hypothetical protein